MSPTTAVNRGINALISDLVRHGLRARLGRPSSRTVVAWASIVTVACGLFAASLGIWLAWLDSRPLHAQEVAAAVAALYPEPDRPTLDFGPNDPPAVFTIWGEPLDWSNVHDLLFFEGGGGMDL
jgi:hypothetical protein